MSSYNSKTLAIKPCQTMRGHANCVNGVVHLANGRRIITGSLDDSLRLWDLDSGAQIDEEWRNKYHGVWSMALSPNGKTIANGSGDCNVRLWDVETKKVISKWTGHTHVVCALCWSADGEQVASGSWDGTARVWDVNSGQNILTIKTGHTWVRAVMYSPDSSKLATGGDMEYAVKIWDAKTGEVLNTLKNDRRVHSLAWTSDGKKFICGSIGPIRIFDTATWQQIAILEGHTNFVNAISLSRNGRFLASASGDKTARLWNLDTNLLVGQPLQHDDSLSSAALSPDGKVLVTGCKNNNAYAWDVHSILKKSGLEDLLPIPNVPTGKPSMNSNATRRLPIQVRRIPQDFFDGVQNDAHSFAIAARDTHPCSPAPHPRSTQASLLERWSSLFRHSRPNTDVAIELQQRSREFNSSHRSPHIVEVPTVQDRKALFVARPAQKTQQQTQSRRHGSSTTLPAPGTNTATPVNTAAIARPGAGPCDIVANTPARSITGSGIIIADSACARLREATLNTVIVSQSRFQRSTLKGSTIHLKAP
ncbi:WD40-repeat-containing domain protein [Suillus americanus]|nr:WD40-repeat-containing domain protein [Suillus americanus]